MVHFLAFFNQVQVSIHYYANLQLIAETIIKDYSFL